MAGGNWTVQNKVRPGAYINFVGTGKTNITPSDRGIVTMPLNLSWGPVKEFVKVEPTDDITRIYGYDMYDSEMLLIKEAFKNAASVLAYRISGGTKASKTSGELTVTAIYEGMRGNDITVKISANPDAEGTFIVKTYLESKEVDEQRATVIADLKANDYVKFTGTGALTENAGIVLSGGSDTQALSADYTAYFNSLELQEFNVIALPVEDNTIKEACVSFVKRMRDTEGKKIQAVLSNCSSADYEGIISVKNGVVLADKTIVNSTGATAWVAGVTAGAQINKSNTYTVYDGAVDTDIKYTSSQIIDALNAGEFVFVPKSGKVVVEQDINTLTTFTPQKSSEFHKNRVIRTLDEIGNTIKRTFEDSYIGKVDNNEYGRLAFKGDIIGYLKTLQNINAVQSFNADSDVEVLKGDEIDSVVVNLTVQPVDSIEKLYMTVKLK